MPIIARHLSIRGRVQGVWYRESMRQAAEAQGAAGWVRNRQDGSVEALVEGEIEVVEALITWAWQGPPAARVDEVVVTDAAASGLGEFLKRDTV